MKYIGIEGSSYTGKTTVINGLQTYGHAIIPEYDAFGPFMSDDGTDEGTIIVAEDFIRREQERTRILDRMNTGSIVFSDRSPLSLITFEDMKIVTHPENAAPRSRAREYLIKRLGEEIAKGTIVFPDDLIVLRLDDEAAFTDRVNQRGVTPVEELSRFTVQQFIADKTIEYGVTLLDPSSVIALNVSHDSPQSATLRVNLTANTIPPSTTQHNIRTMLG
jgi:hypothetical protein